MFEVESLVAVLVLLWPFTLLGLAEIVILGLGLGLSLGFAGELC